MKWELYGKVQRPEKRASSLEEGLSILPEVEWAVADFQSGMTQDKEKLICRCATSWNMVIFLRGGVELFTGGGVSWCWAELVMKEIEKESMMNYFSFSWFI